MNILNNVIYWRGKDYNSPSPWPNTAEYCQTIKVESVDKTSVQYNGGGASTGLILCQYTIMHNQQS